ncbi:geranylgeranyl pyrophosphate synthetase [Massariosphaeria phaeospora]|uniref:Geranylgeranyl pyrophosphate synthetase n=1 Tax=Massariosphaeria phaeospora TaxID=100035 RepID=A0A7C8M9W8_9PLEO|nr:geranylgeranyl pyrophosphate synthetase [Massariosphaeria phaeospora]
MPPRTMASTTRTVAEISRQNLQDLSTHPGASITDVKQLSSYNWIEAPTPTIAVPGSPPLWSAPKGPRQLKPDSGFIYIGQNAARHPDSPLEPLFRALYTANPSFDIRSIDVVTDRNNIRKLLSFVDPGLTRFGLESFTIKIEVTNNTAIFCREETATSEFITPDQFRGYGHEFEKAYTTGMINRSTGHHRIISYRFNNLNFVIRHETDGYLPLPSSGSQEGSLASMLGSLSLSPTDNPPNTTPAGSKLTIQEEGKVVPLETTLEIKTRVVHKPLTIHEVAPQLWISQTPKLVRAYHRRGTFHDPEVEDVSAEIKRWEERNQKNLRKLGALISRIVDMAKEFGGNAVLKCDATGDRLVVAKAAEKKFLPKDLYAKWDDSNKLEVAKADHDAETSSAVKAVDGAEPKPDGKSGTSRPEGHEGRTLGSPSGNGKGKKRDD